MAGEDDVIIKVATDVASALTGLKDVIASLSGVTEKLSATVEAAVDLSAAWGEQAKQLGVIKDSSTATSKSIGDIGETSQKTGQQTKTAFETASAAITKVGTDVKATVATVIAANEEMLSAAEQQAQALADLAGERNIKTKAYYESELAEEKAMLELMLEFRQSFSDKSVEIQRARVEKAKEWAGVETEAMKAAAEEQAALDANKLDDYTTYLNQRGIKTKEQYEKELEEQEKLLATMLANEERNTKETIAIQKKKVEQAKQLAGQETEAMKKAAAEEREILKNKLDDVTDYMNKRGVRTKDQYQKELEEHKRVLHLMQLNEKDYTEESIKQQQRRVEETKRALGQQTEVTKSFFQMLMSGFATAEMSAVAWGQQMSQAIDSVKRGIANLVTAFPSMIASVAATGDAIGTLSNRLGIAVEDIAELQFIAKQSGANMESLARTIQTFTGELSDSSSDAAKAVDKLGLSTDALLAKDPKQAFFEIIAAIQKTVPAAKQGAVAMEIFGSKFRTSTMLLREDVKALQADFKSLGGGMTTELARASDEYEDNMNRIRLVQENFRNSIVNAVLPALNDLLHAFPKVGGAAVTFLDNLWDLGKAFGPLLLGLMQFKSAQLLSSFAQTADAAAKGSKALTGALWLQDDAQKAVTLSGKAMGAAGILGTLARFAGWAIPIGVTVTSMVEGARKASEQAAKIAEMSTPLATLGEAEARMFKASADLGEAERKLYQLKAARKTPDELTPELIDAAVAVQNLTAQSKAAKAGYDETFTAIQLGADGSTKRVSALTAKMQAIDAVLKQFSPTIRDLIVDLDRKQATAEEIAIELGERGITGKVEHLTAAVGRFLDEFEKAQRAAEKTSFAKAVKAAKELTDEMQAAAATGMSGAEMMELFGEEAQKVVTVAQRIPNAIKEVNVELINFATNASKADLSKAFKAADLARLEKFKETYADIKGQIMAIADAMGDNLVKAITNITSLNKKMGEAGLSDLERRLLLLKEEEDAHVEAARTKAGVSDLWRAQEVAAWQQYYAMLRGIETKNTGDWDKDMKLRGQKTKADQMKALNEYSNFLKQKHSRRGEFTDKEIADDLAKEEAMRDQLANNLNHWARERGLKTKEMAEKERKEAAAELALMLKDRKKWSADVIRDMKEKAGVFTATGAEMMQGLTEGIANFSTIAGAAGKNLDPLVSSMGVAASAGVNLQKSWKGLKESFGAGEAKANFDQMAAGLVGIASAAGQVSEAFMGMGTNQLQNIMQGAMAGMSAAAAFGWQAAIVGFVAGAATGWAMNRDAQRAFDDIGADMGVRIAESTALAIQTTGNQLFGGGQGGRWAAEVFHLADIIKDAGGVTARNFAAIGKQFNVGLNFLKDGTFTVAQFQDMADRAFPLIAQHVVKLGGVWNAQFKEIVRRIQEANVEVAALKELMQVQMGVAAQGLDKIIGGFSKKLDPAMTDVKKLREENKKLSEEQQGINDDLAKQREEADERTQERLAEIAATISKNAAEIKRITGETVANSQAEFDRLGRISFATFNAMIAHGESMNTAIAAIGPSIDSLNDQMETLGFEGGEAFDQLARFRMLTNENAELIESVAGLNEMMAALDNLGALNQETFSDMEAQALQAFDELQKAGFSETESLTQMKPLLETIRAVYNEHGFAIDDNTKKILQQAGAWGPVQTEQEKTQQVLAMGFSAILEAFGKDVPEALKKMAEGAETATADVNKSIEKNVTKPLDDTSKKVDKIGWEQFAKNADRATTMASKGLGKLDDSLSDVDRALAEQDWEAWAQEAVEAADSVAKSVDTVSLGSSPGGLKEIPLKMAEAIKAFKAFEDIGVGAAEEVYDAVNSIDGARVNVAAGAVGDAEFRIRDDERIHNEELLNVLAEMTEAYKESQIVLNFDVTAMNADGLKQAVEQDILPTLINAVDRNNRGSLTRLRQMLVPVRPAR